MNDSNRASVQRYDHKDDFYQAALSTIVDRINNSLTNQKRCSIAISGGNTPLRLFELLAQAQVLDWNRIDLFWVDERMVPGDHPDSNFGAANDLLIAKVPIPQGNVHRIVTEGFSPKKASDDYERQLLNYFEGQLPEFDLMLLGMGADGHTASLFPQDKALDERKKLVVDVDGKNGKPPVPRVTLTLPVINNSKFVLFLVAGENKIRIFEEIVEENNTADYPAGLVNPNGELIWCVFNKDLGPIA